MILTFVFTQQPHLKLPVCLWTESVNCFLAIIPYVGFTLDGSRVSEVNQVNPLGVGAPPPPSPCESRASGRDPLHLRPRPDRRPLRHRPRQTRGVPPLAGHPRSGSTTGIGHRNTLVWRRRPPTIADDTCASTPTSTKPSAAGEREGGSCVRQPSIMLCAGFKLYNSTSQCCRQFPVVVVVVIYIAFSYSF